MGSRGGAGINLIEKMETRRLENTIRKVFRVGSDVGRIIICPLVMHELTWRYFLLAAEESKKQRVYSLHKLSRAIKLAYGEFRDYVQKRVGYQEFFQIAQCADMFTNDNEEHLQLLYFPANQALKNTRQELPYEEMQTYALSAYLLSAMCELNSRELLAEIEERCEDSNIAEKLIFAPQVTFKAAELMKRYVGEQTFAKVNMSDINLRRAIAVIYIQFQKFNIDIDIDAVLHMHGI